MPVRLRCAPGLSVAAEPLRSFAGGLRPRLAHLRVELLRAHRVCADALACLEEYTCHAGGARESLPALPVHPAERIRS
jgi:hypothetical protein